MSPRIARQAWTQGSAHSRAAKPYYPLLNSLLLNCFQSENGFAAATRAIARYAFHDAFVTVVLVHRWAAVVGELKDVAFRPPSWMTISEISPDLPTRSTSNSSSRKGLRRYTTAKSVI